MTSIQQIVDDIIGRQFEIQCAKIVLRGRDDSIPPCFAGPGSITGFANGPFTVKLHNTLEKDAKESIRLWNNAARGLSPLCFDATDYHGLEWTGGWLYPIIHGSSASRCFIEGQFPQLVTDLPLTSFDRFGNSTVNYYSGDLSLPMLEVANIQKLRSDEIEEVSTEWDRTRLDFDGASLVVEEDAERNLTSVSTAHGVDWQAPYCETALADALAFVCATPARPRISIRYSEKTAKVFVRETPPDTSSGMPRPIAYRGPRDAAFWNLFLAFLRDCKRQKEFFSTRLSRLFSELVSASTGTVHAQVLSLVVGIEDVVEQIVGPAEPAPGIGDLKEHILQWPGDAALRGRAIGLLSSMLVQTSPRQQLKELATQGVVTLEQMEIWAALRPKLAHGKVTDYDDAELWAKRNQLVTMFYRLVARLIRYRGKLTDYATVPPNLFDLQWSEDRAA